MKSVLYTFIKITIIVLLLGVLYYQLFIDSKIQHLQGLFVNQYYHKNLFWILPVFLLMFLNWGLEAIRWQYIYKSIQPISLTKSFYAVITGTTAALITPNRLGEYPARIALSGKFSAPLAISSGVIGSIAQSTVTVLFGLVGLLYYFSFIYILPINNYLLLFCFIFLILSTGLIYFKIPFLVKYFFTAQRYRNYIQFLEKLTHKKLKIIFLLSFSRYIVYTAQYLILLQLFGIDSSIVKMGFMITLVYLAQMLIPTMAMAELGIKGNASIFFIGFVSKNLIAILAAAVSLWVINLLVPAIIGMAWLFKEKMTIPMHTFSFRKIYRQLVWILFIPFLFISANTKDCAQNNTAFNIGEVLTYRVNYNWGLIWVGAGEVTFKVNTATLDNKSTYHVIGTGHTYSEYDWFFKVRDTYQTYMDRQTLLPINFIRNVSEGGYEIKNNVTFDRTHNTATSVNGIYNVPECIHDVLSAVYKSRCINYNQYQYDDTIPLTIFLDDQVYPIYIRYLGKDIMKTKLGKFNCIKFKPLLIDGTIFEGGENMTVWVTDDENKIPIRVESPIIVGTIKVDLISYSGLRNKMKAQLK